MKTKLDTYKEVAINFLLNVAKGKIDEAYAEHIADEFIHHNIHFKGDRNSLLQAMKESHQQYPHKVFDIRHVLQDVDLVAVHSHVKLNSHETGFAVIHLFRFRKNKVVEMWDLMQPVPEESPNKNGMF